MSKIESFGSKEDFTRVRDLIRDVLAPELAKIGVSVQPGKGTYSPDGQQLTMKLEMSIIKPDGTVETKYMSDFKDYAHLYGFKPEDLNKEFRSRGVVYRITGLDLKRRKNPIMAENVANHKTYLFVAEDVVRLMERSTTPPPRQGVAAGR